MPLRIVIFELSVMNIVVYIALIVLSIGFCMTMFTPETSRKRYLGWLMMAITIIIYTILRFISGNIAIASVIFNIGIGAVDFFLAYFWYGQYRKAKDEKELKRLNNRERFLREIKSKKW